MFFASTGQPLSDAVKTLVEELPEQNTRFAMDPVTFVRIKGDLQQKHFKNEKFEVLRSTIPNTYSYISVEQVAELVREFSFDDEKLEVVQVCVGKMCPSTCAQVVPLLSSFSFDGKKVKVVETIAHIIVDPANHRELDRAITFISDRNKAREAILARQSMGPSPSHHHQHQYPPPPHSHYPPPPHHHPSFPGQYPAGQVVPPPYNPYPPAPGYVPYPPREKPPPHAPGLLNAALHAVVYPFRLPPP